MQHSLLPIHATTDTRPVQRAVAVRLRGEKKKRKTETGAGGSLRFRVFVAERMWGVAYRALYGNKIYTTG
ncbi:hypothetical protein BaRGS_00019273 [Batillaria attramentaria]|uniref:Uncharacterized protein n=1 Tax=Batillaria attramentaria TaxID=370345 RepID=A0ABD0KR99_9CAEN